MNVGLSAARVRLALARSGLLLLLLGAYRLARCALVWIGIGHGLGPLWATALVLLALLMRWRLLLQAAAALTLIAWWHWPVPLALLVVAPRLVTVLPGLIRTWGASVRHPRPRWSAVGAAAGTGSVPAGAQPSPGG